MKFDFTGIKLNWFPGHMATSLKYMRNRLIRDVELIVEVRDARIPYSSQNPLLQESDKPRLIVFNKSDLTPQEMRTRLASEGILTRKDRPEDIKKLLEAIKNKFPNSKFDQKHRVMIMGIPNVGKSTLLNALRLHGTGLSGKATPTGFLPGVTKSVSEVIKISQEPLIYLLDTPGITQPRLDNAETAMKIAVCGGLYDKVVGWRLPASYLLFLLQEKKNENFKEFYRIPKQTTLNSIDEFLTLAASRIGAKNSLGLDSERAALHFIHHFRLGKFGPINLDL